MVSVNLRLAATNMAARYALPELDIDQQRILEASRWGHVIVRTASGAGKTTTALSILKDAVDRGCSAMMWAADRARADHIEPYAQVLAPTAVRPVRTPSAFAYSVVSTWRTHRADPLGPVQLITGAQEDQIIADLLGANAISWPSNITSRMREMPAFRMEIRNLFSSAQEARIGGDMLSQWGESLARPEWVSAGQLLSLYEHNEDFSVSTRNTMLSDISHIQNGAAALIDQWDNNCVNEGVNTGVPVPDVIIVDDLQDCTLSTVTLLGAMARAGTTVVAFSSPDVAVATYRGGQALLDLRLSHRLNVGITGLLRMHRGGSRLHSLWQDSVSHATISGPIAHRLTARSEKWTDDVGSTTTTTITQDITEGVEGISATGEVEREDHAGSAETADGRCGAGGGGVGAGCAGDGGASAADRNDSEIFVHLTGTQAQMGALCARHMRSNHLYHSMPWHEQVVLVRSSSMIEPVKRQLTRGGVPVSGGRRVFTFSAEPSTRILLKLACREEMELSEGEDLAHELISSPYVNVDLLDIHRVLRECQSAELCPDGQRNGQASVTLMMLLDDPSLLPRKASETIRSEIGKASALWNSSADSKTHKPLQALWQLWETAGVANRWRDNALKGNTSSEWFDDQLDAVLALFRVADVWEQRYADGTVNEFATQILSEVVPTDTISRSGQRPEGVEVLTPIQAMGRQWPVVCIVGVQDGTWPNMDLRDRVLRSDVVAELADKNAADPVTVDRVDDSIRTARKARLDEEWRVFSAALTRSQGQLRVYAVRDAQDRAPSSFLDVVVSHTDDASSINERPLERVGSPLSMSGHVASLRHACAQPEESPQRDDATNLLAYLAEEGINDAMPSRWMGAGGISTDTITNGGIPTLSPSRVESMLECPLKWFFASIGAEVPLDGNRKLGTVIHDIASGYPHGPYQNMLDELRANYDDLGYDQETAFGRHSIQTAEMMINSLWMYMQGVPGNVLCEEDMSADLGGVKVFGRIDRLEEVDGGPRITDIKTGKTIPSQASIADNPQLATYQVAAQVDGVTPQGGRLVFVSKESPKIMDQPAFDDNQLDQWRRKLSELGTITRGPHFSMSPSEQVCRTCSFLRSCPAKEASRRSID